MNALLEDRVTALLVDRPDSTFVEINRAIPCLSKTLQGILESPLFEQRDGRWRIAGTSGRREPVRPRPRVPQADRMLAVLRGGGWHTIGQLWDAGVGRPNSRATDLRKRGYLVEHRHNRGETLPSRAHQYRIVGLLDAGTGSAVSASSGRDDGGDLAAQQTDGQLVLTGAAFRRGGS